MHVFECVVVASPKRLLILNVVSLSLSKSSSFVLYIVCKRDYELVVDFFFSEFFIYTNPLSNFLCSQLKAIYELVVYFIFSAYLSMDDEKAF